MRSEIHDDLEAAARLILRAVGKANELTGEGLRSFSQGLKEEAISSVMGSLHGPFVGAESDLFDVLLKAIHGIVKLNNRIVDSVNLLDAEGETHVGDRMDFVADCFTGSLWAFFKSLSSERM